MKKQYSDPQMLKYKSLAEITLVNTPPACTNQFEIGEGCSGHCFGVPGRSSDYIGYKRCLPCP
ncbi:MAG: hypothetical protein HZA78_10945 [Candidatus Schekmanbacteria bacterium]|nr:hypothetical protein [Candidatus Schekmanbacteria bacterium]